MKVLATVAILIIFSCNRKTIDYRLKNYPSGDYEYVESFEIRLSIEYYRKLELIDVFQKDSINYCYSYVISSTQREKLDTFFKLTQDQVETLEVFKMMIKKDSMESNVAPISGRLGKYIYHSKKGVDSTESRELYSLIKSLGIRKRGI